MYVDEAETDLLKKWIIKKLEDISDADSDVLADYVLALVKTEDLKPVAKTTVVENLKDFLGSNTESFVEDVFRAISSKSYDPAQPEPKPAAPIYHPLKRQSFDSPRQSSNSRKRSYHDWDREEDMNGQIHPYHGAERPMKHLRRDARGHDLRGWRQSQQPAIQFGLQTQPPMPQIPTPPPGMPPLDPNNPMAAFLAMQQAMSMFPGMPNGASPPDGSLYRPPPTGQRCRDYDTKGFCAAGASCPYEHGEDPHVVPRLNQEYDPNNSTLLNVTPARVGQVDTAVSNRGRGGFRARGRGRGSNNFRGGVTRSRYSQAGPNRDISNTSIVVEQIPVDYCDEKSIRGFFEEFGEIEEVTIHAEMKLAIIRYDSHQAARKAYKSPKVVFDNRFVKVYWHSPQEMAELFKDPPNSARIKYEDEDYEMPEEEQIDLAEVAKRQEEAQRKYEEANRQREETEKRKQELDVQLKAMKEERNNIADMIAKKAGRSTSLLDESPTQIKTEESEETKALKAQLAKLEAEAKSLGLDPEAVTNGYNGHSSYRGRGGYRGRGRGRGSYRGYRGGWAGAGATDGAVMRLDNRPKTIAVIFVEGTYENRDEALRQFLLFNSLDSASLAKHPDREDAALVTFTHRYEGENFMAAAGTSELVHIGKVELSWYKKDDKAIGTNGSHEPDVKMETAVATEQPSSDVQIVDGYDVAEEEDLDRWS